MLRALAALLVVLALAPGLGARGAQDTGSVRGIVIDARTGQPLAKARVTLTRRPARVQTDDQGRFLLADQTAGPATLEVSLVGYALVQRDITIPPGDSLDLAIPLAEGTGTYTEAVQVTGALYARSEVGVAGQVTIGSAELQELRGLLADDPMRAVQALPGVGGTDDFRSDFSVRASDFRHVNVSLDGIPSPLLVHTVRNADDAGSLAMINSDILDSVSLLSGSYPQRYGNSTGAQVEFRSRDGSRDRRQLRVSLSAINASMVAEGPIGRTRRGSWLVSARKSYLDWLIRRIDPDITGTFGFVDSQAKLVYDLTPRQTVQAGLVAGRSRYDERDEDPGVNSLEVGRHRSILASLTLRSTLRPSTVLTQRVYGVFNRFTNTNAEALPLDRGTEHDRSYRADLTSTGPKGTIIEAGLHLQSLRVSGEDYAYIGVPAQRAGTTFTRTHARQGAYALARLQPAKVLTLSPGVRVDRWGLTGETLVSPWIQAELALPHGLLAAAGTGLHRQAPETLFVDGPRGAPLTAERARHLDAGIGQQAGPWRWQVTTFDRAEDDMIRLPGSEPRLVDGRVVLESFTTRYENALTGWARGAEASLQRRSANGLSGWIGYAFVASRLEDRARAERFPADREQRHTLNVYASYRLSTRTSVSARFRAATNTPIAGYYQPRSDGLYMLAATRNDLRLPFYSRLDVRGNRTFDVRGGRLTLFVEVLNVYNRRNQRASESPSIVRRTGAVGGLTEELFPIVPSAGLRIEF